jgi:hypothetical protein
MTSRLRVPLVALLALGLRAAAGHAGAGELFSSYEVVPLRLNAPFNELFERARANPDYTVTGTLAFGDAGRDKTIEGVSIGLRGHTSLSETECTFPKLKVQLPRGAVIDGSPLAGLSSLKIGTHCGESSDGSVSAKYGRLPNEQSPYREAFVYRLLDAVGVPSLKARPARITYVYNDAKPRQTPDQQQPIVRNALLLENTEEAVKRLGAAREISEIAFTNAHDQFSASDTAVLAFGDAMIGNFDWCLKMRAHDSYRCNVRHPLWNIVAAAGSDGHARPIMYDFDVAGMVAGDHRWFKDVYNDAFVASRSHAAIEVLGQVQRTRTLFGRTDLDAARAHFMQKKADAYSALAAATVDPAGKQRIQEYLDSFFDAIGPDESFYRPVVVGRGAMPYADASRASVVCTSGGAIPIGTPVSDPQQKNGQMMQVVLLDVLWHWAPPATCPAIHEGAAWIDASTVSRDFPTAPHTP